MTHTTLLATLIQNVKEIQSGVKVQLEQAPIEKLNQKADVAQWSVLECIQHLNLYNRYYLRGIENSLTKAEKIISEKEQLKSTVIGKMSITMMKPENIKKQKTFKRMNPSKSKLDRGVFTEFLQQQEWLLALLLKAELMNLNKGRVKVEFFKLLAMTTGEALEFVVVHQQRHINQAFRALEIINIRQML